jgi:hypothetical protein
MRARMQEMGLAPRGPTDVAGAGEAEHDLAGKIPVKVSRAGDPPTFPPMPAPERRDSTDCGWRLGVPWLEPLSDTVLEQSGGGRASPLLVFQDGRPLAPHALPAAFEKACRFSFRHGPKYVFLSPDGAVDAIGGTWSLGLDDAVPLPRGGDGRPMYWVYPGTTLTFELGAGWDEDRWGPLAVTVDARVVYVGTPEEPSPKPGAPVTVTFLGFEQSGRDKVFGLKHEPDPPDGPWTIEVVSPPGGPYVLLDTLRVGNDEHALALTGPGDDE